MTNDIRKRSKKSPDKKELRPKETGNGAKIPRLYDT